MVSSAQKRAMKRYQRKTKTFTICINPQTEPDIYSRICSVDSITGYIKGLIRADLARIGS